MTFGLHTLIPTQALTLIDMLNKHKAGLGEFTHIYREDFKKIKTESKRCTIESANKLPETEIHEAHSSS